MKYSGKLYGKVAGKHFDTGRTTEDWDALVEALKDCHECLRNLNDPNGYEPQPITIEIEKAEKHLQEWEKRNER